MSSKKIEINLKANRTGFISSYLWQGVWLLIFLCLNYWSIGLVFQAPQHESTLFLCILLWSISLFVGGVLLNSLSDDIFYLPNFEYRLSSDEEGKKLVRATASGPAFIKGRTQKTILFDRITGVDVSVSTFARMFGVGTVGIRYVTFVNNETREGTFYLRGIAAPYEVALEILDLIPPYEGLPVELKKPQQA